MTIDIGEIRAELGSGKYGEKHQVTAALCDEVERLRELGWSGCPCTLVDPCSGNCSCAQPILSGGCRRCANYGDDLQRTVAAARLAELIDGADQPQPTASAAEPCPHTAWRHRGYECKTCGAQRTTSEMRTEPDTSIDLCRHCEWLRKKYREVWDRASSLFEAIAHGDDEHRDWLREAIANHLAGKPVPPPNGKGRAEAAEAKLQRVRDLVDECCSGFGDCPVESFHALLREFDAPPLAQPCDHDYPYRDDRCLGCQQTVPARAERDDLMAQRTTVEMRAEPDGGLSTNGADQIRSDHERMARKEIERLKAENERLRAELAEQAEERLREKDALDPFAYMYVWLHAGVQSGELEGPLKDEQVIGQLSYGGGSYALTVGHMRRAYEAFVTPKAQP